MAVPKNLVEMFVEALGHMDVALWQKPLHNDSIEDCKCARCATNRARGMISAWEKIKNGYE